LNLGIATPQRLLRPLHDGRHQRRIERLVNRFAVTFPEIAYDVLWTSRTRNAQAFVWDGRKSVRLYGGLARHAGISVAAIAWILAHETGHHLGGLPSDPFFPWISSEDGANHWAVSFGLKRVFGQRLARRYAHLGRREANQLAAASN
jgi:peptidase M48-like protein